MHVDSNESTGIRIEIHISVKTVSLKCIIIIIRKDCTFVYLKEENSGGDQNKNCSHDDATKSIWW